MKPLSEIYATRISEFAEKAKYLSARYNRFALVRLIIFIAGLATAVFLYSINAWLMLGFIVVFLIAFARFIFWHQAIQRARRFNEALVKVNQNEAAAMAGDYQVFGNGRAFLDPLHPYTVDLDIFGDYSVFQYFNRTTTAIGSIRLSEYFKTPVSENIIKERHTSIIELKEKLDWRQDFQAHGSNIEDSIDHIRQLNNWLAEAPFISNKAWIVPVLILNPIYVIGVIFLFTFYLPWYVALLLLIPTLYLLNKTKKQIDDAHEQTSKAGDILADYALLIAHLETAHFESGQLVELQKSFHAGGKLASVRLKKMAYIISQLNVRYNPFVFFLNVIGLWDLFWIRRLEQWKAKEKDDLPAWFDALREFEALISLSTAWYNNPEWSLPIIHQGQQLTATQIAHPLIDRKVRVANDFASPTNGHIKLVTGSNMAGKSTFLRTIGLNIVLAAAGSAICAERFSLPILQVHTSMRTQDALHESTSSFYAELKRLKTIIAAVENGENIYFLLDEILKGTNSNDRHTGSKALIKQLIKSGGGGIIATHDLELGALEAKYDGRIENLCMEVAIENGKLDFDYTIKKGVSQSFNATLLMKEMGIRIDEL